MNFNIIRQDFFQARWMAPYGLLLLAVFMAYCNIYHNAFLGDDDTLIVRNPLLQSWNSLGAIFSNTVGAGAGPPSPFYRPLQTVLYLTTYQLFGLSLPAFHFVNIALHAANACLVYNLALKLRFNPSAAFFGALIWALHPIHTEAVTYMSATADVLYAFFCLSGLLVLLPVPSPRRLFFASLLFILALLSKETAITFPGLAAICLFLLSAQRSHLKAYLCLWPPILIGLVYVCIHLSLPVLQFHTLSPRTTDVAYQYVTSIIIRFYTFAASLPLYIQLIIWPTDLHMEHQFPIYLEPWHWNVIAGVLIVGLSVAGFCLHKQINLIFCWALGWAAVTFSVISGVLFPVNALFLEHWMYVPSVGLILATAQGIAYLLKQKTCHRWRFPVMIIAVVASFLLGTLTYIQNKTWADPFTFYTNILKYEKSPRALNNLGIAYMLKGKYDIALEKFHQAIALADIFPEPHRAIAYIMIQQPDWKEHPEGPIAELKRALYLDPDYLPAYQGLIYIYKETGNNEELQKLTQ
jgi:hypothetical protein